MRQTIQSKESGWSKLKRNPGPGPICFQICACVVVNVFLFYVLVQSYVLPNKTPFTYAFFKTCLHIVSLLNERKRAREKERPRWSFFPISLKHFVHHTRHTMASATTNNGDVREEKLYFPMFALLLSIGVTCTEPLLHTHICTCECKNASLNQIVCVFVFFHSISLSFACLRLLFPSHLMYRAIPHMCALHTFMLLLLLFLLSSSPSLFRCLCRRWTVSNIYFFGFSLASVIISIQLVCVRVCLWDCLRLCYNTYNRQKLKLRDLRVDFEREKYTKGDWKLYMCSIEAKLPSLFHFVRSCSRSRFVCVRAWVCLFRTIPFFGLCHRYPWYIRTGQFMKYLLNTEPHPCSGLEFICMWLFHLFGIRCFALQQQNEIYQTFYFHSTSSVCIFHLFAHIYSSIIL